jgi:hypothetical protein
MNEEKIYNAIIESAEISLDRDAFLCAWVHVRLDKACCQGFGGFVLGGIPSVAAGAHGAQKNLAAECIVKILLAADVTEWSKLRGKTIRIKKHDMSGPIVAIGHIIEDDRWFNPKETFEAMK